MCYADTCYVLAYLRPGHAFHSYASLIKSQIDEQQRKVWASEILFFEILVAAKKLSVDPVRLVRDALALIEPDNFKEETVLKAARIMQKYGNGPADCIHIANSLRTGTRLVTSDLDIHSTLKALPEGQYVNLRSPNPKI